MQLITQIETVTAIDHAATGAAARQERQVTKLSIAAVAKQMNLSTSYLCDLELARRPWSELLVDRFNLALAKLKQPKRA